MGSFVKIDRGRALKLSWNSRAWFAKNFHKCFSYREGSLGKADGMILVPRISKRQRAAFRGSIEKQRQHQ